MTPKCADAAAMLYPFGEAAVLAQLLQHASCQPSNQRDAALAGLLNLYSVLLDLLPMLDAKSTSGT